MIYKLIGKAVVHFGLAFIKRRYGRQLAVAAAVATVAIGIGGYLATKDVSEG